MKVYHNDGYHLIVLEDVSFEFSSEFTLIDLVPKDSFLTRWFKGWRLKTLTSAEFLVLQERLSLERIVLSGSFLTRGKVDVSARTLEKIDRIGQLEEALKVYLESQ